MNVTAINTTDAAPAAVAVLIDRAPLAAALAFAAGVIVERRNTIPILSNVLIEATEAGARIRGTDLDIEASIELAAAWDVPGAFTADARALADAVKASDGDTVRLTLDGAAVVVAGETMAARVPALPAGDFPTMVGAAGDSAASFAIDAAQLAADWSRAAVSVSTEETRYYLNGVYMHPVPGASADVPPMLGIAATDGHRLTSIRRPMPTVTGADMPAAIFPRKLVGAVLKVLGSKASGAVAFDLHAPAGRDRIGTRCRIVAAGWTFESKMIDGTFPDYTRVIPSANGRRATMSGADLIRVLGAVGKVGGRKGAGALSVDLSAEHGARLVCTCEGARSAGGLAAAWSELHGEGAGQPAEQLTIGFNPRYMADVARVLGKGSVSVDLADAGAPALFTAADAPELTVVLMPMRIDGATPAAKSKPAAAAPAAAPAPRPVGPSDAFERDYAAAWVARDMAALRGALETFRAAMGDGSPLTHREALAGRCARLRSMSAPNDEAYKLERRRVRVAGGRVVAWGREGGGFKRLGAAMKARASNAAVIAALDGFRADDPRDVAPVVLTDGARAFVLQNQLADADRGALELVRADGTPKRSRKRGLYHVMRNDIARVIQPREARQPRAAAPVAPVEAPAAAPDVAALVATMAALAARVAGLESTVAAQAEELASRPAVAEPAAVSDTVAEASVPALDPTDARDAYVAALLAERAELRDRVEAAEARAADFERIATAADARADGMAADMQLLEGLNRSHRRRRAATAARLVKARAATRTATREQRGTATALRIADAELARLQPLAAALAALVPAPAPVTGGNVVPLHAAA